MLHAVVMAGGSGSRFWPESRELRPKQLLALAGNRSMIQATVDRLEGVVPPERTIIATSAALAPAIAEELRDLKGLPPGAIIAEPCQRDTAPCIALAALHALHSDPDATLVVLPADHVIDPPEAFRESIRVAAEIAARGQARIVTFGIRPTYPAQSFGYIEQGAVRSDLTAGSLEVYAVDSFREKPSAAIAEQYVEAGRYYWNSGIFVWKAQTVLDELRSHQPKIYARFERIAAAWGRPDHQQVLEEEFAALPRLSIDFAVLEHAQDVVVIEAPFRWDDVGSWQAFARLEGTDEHGNTSRGRHLNVDSRGTIVRAADGHLIVTLGLRDCLIVHTADATLIADKHQEEAIRRVVKELRERGWNEYL
jgi:mannose-1-phosphate guanylyltransferase